MFVEATAGEEEDALEDEGGIFGDTAEAGALPLDEEWTPPAPLLLPPGFRALPALVVTVEVDALVLTL